MAPFLEVEAGRESREPEAYFRLLLTAHYGTVGSFCPTDVDARIRHHVWQECRNDGDLRGLLAVFSGVAAYDPRLVSKRVLTRTIVVDAKTGDPADFATPSEECLSGHDGEWLAVKAGALGRALGMVPALAAKLVDELEEELWRQAKFFVAETDPRRHLLAATILAHNVGDLSRVVAAYPDATPHKAQMVARFCDLGHATNTNDTTSVARFDGIFVAAGALNKAKMARENHRFLPLRKALPLRESRALLLPIGPFFDSWGETLGQQKWAEREQVTVFAALLEGHLASPDEAGYVRALSGYDRTLRRGLISLVDGLPVRLGKAFRQASALRRRMQVPEAKFIEQFLRH